MVEVRRLRLAQAPQDGASTMLELAADGANVTTGAVALLRFYRAKADECEWIARQISLTPDRQYFLSCARELRAKAAALESESA